MNIRKTKNVYLRGGMTLTDSDSHRIGAAGNSPKYRKNSQNDNGCRYDLQNISRDGAEGSDPVSI